MSELDITRKSEEFLVGKLRTALPTRKIYPYAGGAMSWEDDARPIQIEPPFVVVGAEEAESMYQDRSTYKVTGTVQILTHIGEDTPRAHSEFAKDVHRVLKNLQSNEGDTTLIFHGLDIGNVKLVTDSASKGRATLITFSAGFGG